MSIFDIPYKPQFKAPIIIRIEAIAVIILIFPPQYCIILIHYILGVMKICTKLLYFYLNSNISDNS